MLLFWPITVTAVNQNIKDKFKSKNDIKIVEKNLEVEDNFCLYYRYNYFKILKNLAILLSSNKCYFLPYIQKLTFLIKVVNTGIFHNLLLTKHQED